MQSSTAVLIIARLLMTESSPARTPKRRPTAPSVYLESRYRKLVRGLPQTIFYCPECKGHRRRRLRCERCEGRGKLTDDSVQELIGKALLPAYGAKSGKFHGAGREDIDVLMLGRGRPFVFELVGPRRTEHDLEDLRKRILTRDGDRIDLEPFRIVERPRVAFWKEGKFDKSYRAEVEFGAAPVEGALAKLVGQKIEVVQRTPQRVAHRRADLERKRWVQVLAASSASSTTCELLMRCEHGTYVKEWISGDDERSTPSLARLLEVEASCLALDVTDIHTEGAADFGVGIEGGTQPTEEPPASPAS